MHSSLPLCQILAFLDLVEVARERHMRICRELRCHARDPRVPVDREERVEVKVAFFREDPFRYFSHTLSDLNWKVRIRTISRRRRIHALSRPSPDGFVGVLRLHPSQSNTLLGCFVIFAEIGSF